MSGGGTPSLPTIIWMRSARRPNRPAGRPLRRLSLRPGRESGRPVPLHEHPLVAFLLAVGASVGIVTTVYKAWGKEAAWPATAFLVGVIMGWGVCAWTTPEPPPAASTESATEATTP